MPTCVITFGLVGVVAEPVTAQSERRSSLRCLVTARVVGRRSVNSSKLFQFCLSCTFISEFRLLSLLSLHGVTPPPTV